MPKETIIRFETDELKAILKSLKTLNLQATIDEVALELKESQKRDKRVHALLSELKLAAQNPNQNLINEA